MFKTILKTIFFTSLIAIVLIVSIQSFFGKLSDIELIIITAISAVIGAFWVTKTKGKYLSRSVGTTTIWVLIALAILMVIYGIFDAVYIYREGMAEMLPYIVIIAAVVPLFTTLIVKFFIKKEGDIEKITQPVVVENTSKSYQFIGRKTGNVFIVLLLICAVIILGYSIVLVTLFDDSFGGTADFLIFWLGAVFVTPLFLAWLVKVFKKK